MTFFDSVGNEIDSFNPGNWQINGAIHEFGENEELIGIYGAKDQKLCFSSFGFVLKVKQA